MKFRVLRSKDYLCSLEIAYRYVVTLIELKGRWYWDGFEKKSAEKSQGARVPSRADEFFQFELSWYVGLEARKGL